MGKGKTSPKKTQLLTKSPTAVFFHYRVHVEKLQMNCTFGLNKVLWIEISICMYIKAATKSFSAAQQQDQHMHTLASNIGSFESISIIYSPSETNSSSWNAQQCAAVSVTQPKKSSQTEGLTLSYLSSFTWWVCAKLAAQSCPVICKDAAKGIVMAIVVMLHPSLYGAPTNPRPPCCLAFRKQVWGML